MPPRLLPPWGPVAQPSAVTSATRPPLGAPHGCASGDPRGAQHAAATSATRPPSGAPVGCASGGPAAHRALGQPRRVCAGTRPTAITPRLHRPVQSV
eukprot:2913449-Alexandrium_andersonii.AAC.1